MLPRVSIITVVRNAPQELERTLNNLTALDVSAAEVELIVIDGASTDDTMLVIRRHAGRLAYWVSEPDEGLYDAMNKGIRAATGDYLWFINAGDTVYAPDTLTQIFAPENAASQSLADVYYGETVVVDSESDRPLGLRKKKLPTDLCWRSLQQGMVVCHQSFIVRRTVAPLYDTDNYTLAADIEWIIECLKCADVVRHTGLILSRFTTGGLSSRRRRKSLTERWRIMHRHYGFLSTAWAHVQFAWEGLLRRKPYRSLP